MPAPPTQMSRSVLPLTGVGAPAPTVMSLNPAQGPISGGTVVQITGQDFVNGATVTVGGVAATSVFYGDPPALTVTVPAGSFGAADVVVTNPDTQTGTLVGGFFYTDVPTLSAISPAAGFSTGFWPVTLTGTHFFDPAFVLIGGYACTTVVVVNTTTITAMAPATPAAIYDVTVTTPASFATLAVSYTVTDPPIL